MLLEADNVYSEELGGMCSDSLYVGDFELTLIPPRNGALCFSLHVCDEQGNVTVSEPICVTVETLPTLRWLTPSPADQIVAGAPFTLSVDATDPDGSVVGGVLHERR